MGFLGLNALLSKGIAGPPYDLSDLKLTVSKVDELYYVDFYDMSCSVKKDDKFYNPINGYFSKKILND